MSIWPHIKVNYGTYGIIIFIKCRFTSALPVVSASAVLFPPAAAAFVTAVAASVVFVIPAA